MAAQESRAHKVEAGAKPKARPKPGSRPRARARKPLHPGLPGPRILDLVDVFLFLADARIPGTSVRLAAPFLTRKNKVYVLAKPDLADRRMTAEWLSFLSRDGTPGFAVDCRTGDGVEDLVRYLKEQKKDVDCKRRSGVLFRPVRLMLFGPPNVGKSSLANRLLGTQKAPFGAKPGLTRGSHWLRGRGFLEVLDTPGVIETSQVKGEARMKLAAVWALQERGYDPQDVAFWLAQKIALAAQADGVTASDAGMLAAFQPDTAQARALACLEDFGKRRGFLRHGGEVDLARACTAFIQAFREGQLGRFTLERPWDSGKPEASAKLDGESSKTRPAEKKTE